MPTIARIGTALMMLAASAVGSTERAAAQNETVCTSQFDCDYRVIQRDDTARKVEYQHMVKSQEDAHAAAMQAVHDAGARAAGNREAKLQAILQHRRDAYGHGLR